MSAQTQTVARAEDFGIDPLRLEEEWQGQAQRTYNAGAAVADAERAASMAKNELDAEMAEASAEVRANPAGFGLAKITDDSVKSAVATVSRVLRAKQNLVDAEHVLGLAKAAYNAGEHRKRALTCLVDLWVREYYADPREGRASLDDVRSRGARRREERGRDGGGT